MSDKIDTAKVVGELEAAIANVRASLSRDAAMPCSESAIAILADALEQERSDRLAAEARIRLLERLSGRLLWAVDTNVPMFEVDDARENLRAALIAPAPKEDGEG